MEEAMKKIDQLNSLETIPLARSDWSELYYTVNGATEIEADQLVNAILQLPCHLPWIQSDGADLIFPILWKPLVMRLKFLDKQSSIFHCLSHLISENVHMCSKTSLSTILLRSSLFVAQNSQPDFTASLNFIRVLVQYALDKEVDISVCVLDFISTCAEQCEKLEVSTWTYLLVASCLLPGLSKLPFPCDQRQRLTECVSKIIDHCMDCLQSKDLQESSAHRRSVIEFLLVLTQFSHNSLAWMRRFGQKEGRNVFALVMTSLVVEVRLQLDRIRQIGDQFLIELFDQDVCLPRQNQCEPDMALLDFCCQLLSFGLKEMNQIDRMSPNAAHHSPLADDLSDEAAQGIWLALCNSSDELRDGIILLGYPGLAKLSEIQTSSSECQFDKPIIPVLLISLLKTYLDWILLYHQTHVAGIRESETDLQNSDDFTNLYQKLTTEVLKPIGGTLWTVLSFHFRDELPSSTIPFARSILFSMADLVDLYSALGSCSCLPSLSIDFPDLCRTFQSWLLDHWFELDNKFSLISAIKSFQTLFPSDSDPDNCLAEEDFSVLLDSLMDRMVEPPISLIAYPLEFHSEALILITLFQLEVIRFNSDEADESISDKLLIALEAHENALNYRYRDSLSSLIYRINRVLSHGNQNNLVVYMVHDHKNELNASDLLQQTVDKSNPPTSPLSTT